MTERGHGQAVKTRACLRFFDEAVVSAFILPFRVTETEKRRRRRQRRAAAVKGWRNSSRAVVDTGSG
jgi:hypothetical protein